MTRQDLVCNIQEFLLNNKGNCLLYCIKFSNQISDLKFLDLFVCLLKYRDEDRRKLVLIPLLVLSVCVSNLV